MAGLGFALRFVSARGSLCNELHEAGTLEGDSIDGGSWGTHDVPSLSYFKDPDSSASAKEGCS